MIDPWKHDRFSNVDCEKVKCLHCFAMLLKVTVVFMSGHKLVLWFLYFNYTWSTLLSAIVDLLQCAENNYWLNAMRNLKLLRAPSKLLKLAGAWLSVFQVLWKVSAKIKRRTNTWLRVDCFASDGVCGDLWCFLKFPLKQCSVFPTPDPLWDMDSKSLSVWENNRCWRTYKQPKCSRNAKISLKRRCVNKAWLGCFHCCSAFALICLNGDGWEGEGWNTCEAKMRKCRHDGIWSTCCQISWKYFLKFTTVNCGTILLQGKENRNKFFSITINNKTENENEVVKVEKSPNWLF